MAEAWAIEANKLSKAFGPRKALDKLDLRLPQGAFLSIFGPNGAGKTTFLRILASLARPSGGSVRVLGFDLRQQPDAARAQIGLISHRSMLYPDLTAQENLELFARLYGVDDVPGRVAQLLATVELTARRHDAVRGFSRGMTQRLAIARALVHDPALVLLDEPYSGLDPHAAQIFDELLAAVRPGRSFCMVSHDLHKGFGLASHLLVLARGKQVLFSAKTDLALESFAALYHETVGQGVA